MIKIGKEKKEKGMFWKLSLLNPKNLAHEVHVYGYDFSWKIHVFLLLCSLIGISAVGLLFELKPTYFFCVIVCVIIVLPMLTVLSYKRMYEQKRFSDLVTYMEQMLYSFQKSGKIKLALMETRELFDEGRMRAVIDRVIDYLQNGNARTENGVLREALEIVEEHYECTKLRTVHELLISSEEYGGDAQDSIQLVLSDLELWKRRGYKLQARKKASHTDNIISIAVATGFCAVALYVLDAMRNVFPKATATGSIFQVEMIQLSSLLFVLYMLYVLTKSQNMMAMNWLQSENLHKKELILESYKAVTDYDEARERKKSLLWSVPFFVGAIIAFCFSHRWLGVCMVAISVFMLFQHKIGYKLARKDVNEELYFALPQWFMEIALLLQSNNVQVSLVKSMQVAPAILQGELQRLMERLEKAPEQLKSYVDFCKEFDVPEVESCMKMLHAMAESGTGNAKIQLTNLVRRVNEMQDMADGIRDEHMAFRAKAIFSYPIFACTAKLLVDLSVGMIFMFQMLGNMGGV